MHRDENKPGEMEVIVDKNRDGEDNIIIPFTYKSKKSDWTLEEVTKKPTPDPPVQNKKAKDEEEEIRNMTREAISEQQRISG